MSQFQNQTTNQTLTPRQTLESKFAKSRHNILLVLIFSVINIILLVTNSDTYFLFSAYIPYMFADFGMLLSGSYPEDYYVLMEMTDLEFLGMRFLWIMMAAAAVVLVLYLLSWILSKKNRTGWMIFALVMICLDTVLLVLMCGISMDLIVDYLFHGWMIVSLSIGVSAGCKMKKLPEEPKIVEPIPAELQSGQ